MVPQMNLFRKIAPLLLISIQAFTFSSFTQPLRQHNKARTAGGNVLEQFYPDQNAYRLLARIPRHLRNLPYGIYPTSRKYDTARFNYNKRFNIFPHLILTPKTAAEAAAVLKKIKRHHLPFSVRSGGHCIEPGSLSSGYIIDLRHFTSIKPNIQKRTVYIGAGCRLGTVIKTLGKRNFAIPTGTCSSVGVTGLSMGGGLGVLGRVFGLTCDSLKSIRLVTAEGDIIKVSRKHHPDLFWALCGGGNGSYGIVLGFTFRMHYVPHVSTLTLSWKWSAETVSEVFSAWQTWVETLPTNITTQLQLKYQNKALSIAVTGLKVGDSSFTEWKKAFAHLNPKVQRSKGSYLDSAKVWADRAPYPFFKSKSEMIMQSLTNEPIETAIAFFEELKQNNENYYAFFELEAMGGAIARGRNAFYPRKALSWWYQVMYWDHETEQARALNMLRTFASNIAPYVSKHSYSNIVDYDLGKDYLDVYYGNHVHRLIEIKNKYDPENLFHWAQSIPVKK